MYLRPLFLHPSRNSDPGKHGKLFSPLPSTVQFLAFFRKKTLALSSLDSRLIAPIIPALGALSSRSYLCKEIQSLISVGFELQDQHDWQHSRVTTINRPPGRPAYFIQVIFKSYGMHPATQQVASVHRRKIAAQQELYTVQQQCSSSC